MEPKPHPTEQEIQLLLSQLGQIVDKLGYLCTHTDSIARALGSIEQVLKEREL